MRRRLSIVVGLLAVLRSPSPAAFAGRRSPFNDWTAVVVAGDWHAHSGGPTEAFDNARRDVAAALQRSGLPARQRRPSSRCGPSAIPDTSPRQVGAAGHATRR